jgi:DeoR family fructose operon transcriptional repressor
MPAPAVRSRGIVWYMAATGSIKAESRLDWIRRRLAEAGTLTIRTAVEELDVSEMTVRRDFVELEALGLARRVRGGAVALGPVAFDERQRMNSKAKARVAEKLMPLVPSTGAIALDSSSTIVRLASRLMQANPRDLLVMTNGIETFAAIHESPALGPMLTGGQRETRTGSLVGPLAAQAARALRYVRFFGSCAGVDARTGSQEPGLPEAEIKRAFADTASEVVLAVDSSKLGTPSLAAALPWERVTVLVTELNPSDSRLDPYRDVTDVL